MDEKMAHLKELGAKEAHNVLFHIANGLFYIHSLGERHFHLHPKNGML
jgi:methylmalonyl-CoA mutase N-terminal domain/subunit